VNSQRSPQSEGDRSIIRVELGPRSYDIEIGDSLLSRAGRFLAERLSVSHAAVITDENVEIPHAVSVAESIGATATTVDLIVVEPGEPSKSAETAYDLWERLLYVGADRKTVVVAVGGGVVGDLAGFAAATFARGLPLVQIPTSLLAQVDSSVGGKVGIDLPAAKNMVGAFLQPKGVLVDIAALDTLLEREFRSGLGEAVKYGVILDAALFDYLEAHVEPVLNRDHAVLREIVARCCRLKADVVERDELETTGLRAVLNYGHTFAHAFETLADYEGLLHGEAVAVGMACAGRLAARLGRVDSAFVARQDRLLAAFGLPIEPPEVGADDVLQTMMHDKKIAHGRLRFVLPTRMGHVELVEDVAPDDVRAAMQL
jgi:3-dehydroquinate synthase